MALSDLVAQKGAKTEQEASDRREELTAIFVLGVTFPSGDMQQQLVVSMYKECGVKPEEVEYVEAHGTGTKVSKAPLGLASYLLLYVISLHHLSHFSIKLMSSLSLSFLNVLYSYISPFSQFLEYVLLHYF